MKDIHILDLDKSIEENNLREVKEPYHDINLPDGLYSQNIFGPVKDYRCQCGILGKGERCPICDVVRGPKTLRSETFGYMTLHEPLIHPFFMLNKYNEILSVIRQNKDNIYDFKSFSSVIDEKFKDDIIYEEFKKRNQIYVNKLIVIPPNMRPKLELEDVSIDDISLIYAKLIRTFKMYKSAVCITPDQYWTTIISVYEDYRLLLMIAENAISKKNGIPRKNILGKNVDFSGRAVIVPNPDISYDEVSVPLSILVDIFRFFFIYELDNSYMLSISSSNIIKKFKKYGKYKKLIFECAEKICKNKLILINRQPTLHRYSMLALRPVPNTENAIGINPIICEPFNADFDGDQMWVYAPQTLEGQEELKRFLPYGMNSVSMADGKCIFKIKEDFVFGAYLLSKSKEGRNILKTYGIELDDSFSQDIVNNAMMKLFVNKEHNKINQLLKLFLQTVSINNNITVTLDQFKLDIDKSKLLTTTDTAEQTEIENKLVKEAMKKCSFSELITSGSRGSSNNIKRSSLWFGYISDYKNNIISTPIKHSLFEGLTKEEFFLSSYGARKGLIDSNLNTSKSGYFSRKLVTLGITNYLSEDDCGDDSGFEFEITNENYMTFRFRYMIDKNKKSVLFNPKDYINKKVRLRSPLRCKSKYGICKKCYGELSNFHNPVQCGVIAAQTLGEISTQLVLRSFHTSGSADLKNRLKNNTSKDIVDELSMVKNIFSQSKDITTALKNMSFIYNNYRKLFHVHYEIIFSNVVWNETYTKLWRHCPPNTPYEIVNIDKSITLLDSLVAITYGDVKRNLSKLLKNYRRRPNILVDRVLLPSAIRRDTDEAEEKK